MRFKSSRAHFVTSYLIVCSYSRRKQSDLCQEKNCLEVMLSKAVVGNKKCQKKKIDDSEERFRLRYIFLGVGSAMTPGGWKVLVIMFTRNVDITLD